MKNKIWNAFAVADRMTNFSRLFGGRRSALLMYHSVGNPGLFGNVSIDRFRSDLEFFTSEYDIMSLSELLSNQKNEEKKQVVLTFDDGYQNFYTNVFPLLKEFDVPATVFVPSTFIGDENETRIRERLVIPDGASDIIMAESQIKELVADERVTLGNHTRTHPDLSTVTDPDQIRDEIVGGKHDLESRFDTSIEYFSFPHAGISDAAVELLRETHTGAVGARLGLAREDSDPHRFPRISAHTSFSEIKWDLTATAEVLRQIYYSK